MFVIYDKKEQNVPIKIWLEDENNIEGGALEQALNLSKLPFVHKWVSLMPDVHQGYGMPIGGVLCTKDVIIPNAVGVDIGCGMGFIETNIPAEVIKNTQTGSGSLNQMLVGQIMRDIPIGFDKHNKKHQSATVNYLEQNLKYFDLVDKFIYEELDNAEYQIGTLGGGNHFIELQEDEDGMLGIMLHSGSRHFGYAIAKHFNKLAEKLNKKYYSAVPKKWGLAFLPIDSIEGQAYKFYMNCALDYAEENREVMMGVIKEKVKKYVEKYTDIEVDFFNQVNCHHNYADIENHYNKNVWVHRKGAIRARAGDIGIIPGAMGSYSYIVEGLGNDESFHSCSHGAGRAMSRTKAKEKFRVQDLMEDLNNQGVEVGTNSKKEKILDECKWAYKDIDGVISNEKDLIKPIKKLKTMAVIKA